MSQSKLYTQKYRKEWESNPAFRGWLKPFIGDDTRAYTACTVSTITKPNLVMYKNTNSKTYSKGKAL
jgi:hypothetical protein